MTVASPPSALPSSTSYLSSPPVQSPTWSPPPPRWQQAFRRHQLDTEKQDNKTQHKLSHKGWVRQSSRKQETSRAGKRVRNTSTPVMSGPQTSRGPSRGPSTAPCRLGDCRFSLCEHPWALLSWFPGANSASVFDSSGSHNSSSPLARGFLSTEGGCRWTLPTWVLSA